MADRAACQRRVYRLALLLTGRAEAAMQVVREVVDAQPNLSRIDSAHLDRLTVLRAREHEHDRLHMPEMGEAFEQAASALCELTPQQREAWVFARVYRMPVREMARAMDCSTTATARHLQLADEQMSRRFSDMPHAADALLKAIMTVDVPSVYYVRMRTRRMIRWLVVALILATVIAGAIVIGYQVQRMIAEG